MRRLVREDADALEKLVSSPKVYHYLPTFLFERKYRDVRQVIERLYDECLRESLILGVFNPEGFCGLAEMYGFRDPIHKISVGYRLLESSWGKGIATQALGLMTRYLLEKTDIEIITASTMLENHASAPFFFHDFSDKYFGIINQDFHLKRCFYLPHFSKSRFISSALLPFLCAS